MLSSRPEFLSQNWFSDLELAFVHFIPMVSQERSFPFELGYDSCWVKERRLLVLLLQTHIELGQDFVWGNAGKRGVFRVIQKSKIKASQPPGDFSVVPTSLALFSCQLLHHADSFLYAWPVLSWGAGRGHAGPCSGWTLPNNSLRVTRQWELTSLLGVWRALGAAPSPVLTSFVPEVCRKHAWCFLNKPLLKGPRSFLFFPLWSWRTHRASGG